MSGTLSLAQSSFLLSSLVSAPPHRADGRALTSYRPIQLAPPVEAGLSRISLGSTSITAHSSCQVVRSTASADHSNEEDDDTGASSSEDAAGEGAGLWNVNITTASNVVPPVQNGGNSSQTGCVELDAQLEHLSHLLKRHLTAAVPVEQFLILRNSNSTASSSHAEKLRGASYWSVHIDVTIESMSGGNLYDAIWAAVYTSLYRCRIPRTREIAYIPPDVDDTAGNTVADLGIKSLKGQGNKKQLQTGQQVGKAVDFELVDGNDDGERIQGRERLGVGMTVGLLPNYTHLLDPSLEEELSLPSSRRLFVVASQSQSQPQQSSPTIHTTHLLPSLLSLTAGEGDLATHVVDSSTGLTIPSDESIRFPKPDDVAEGTAQWEQNGSGWGVPSYARIRQGAEFGGKLAVELGAVLRQSLDQEK